MSGPITVVTPNMAMNRPMYRPRSRGDTTSPTMVWAPIIKPPPPSPCTARKTISWSIEWLNPESADPTRKMTMAA